MRNTKLTTTPISDNLLSGGVFADNELCDALLKIPLIRMLNIGKRSGDSINSIVFTLLIWPLLQARSIRNFCGGILGNYIRGGEDVIYRFQKRADINWGNVSFKCAKKIFENTMSKEPELAIVADDTNKKRRGKKVEGASLHYDHNTGANIFGHQVLQLGLVGSKGFIPLVQQLSQGKKQAVEVNERNLDKRNSAFKMYRDSQDLNKNQLLRVMIKKVISRGIRATFFLADSWFGNRENIKSVIELGLTGIFQMRRGNLKYRLNGNLYTAHMLHSLVKRKMKAMKGSRFRTYALNVELDLETDNSKESEWVGIRLVFSSDRKNYNSNWVVFLSTDPKLNANEILFHYSKRWSIEVYFKEAKQYLGFLHEQSGDIIVCYASMNLTAIRYLLLFFLMCEDGRLNYGNIRDQISKKFQTLSFVSVLWECFRALLSQTLKSFCDVIGSVNVKLIMKSMDNQIYEFLSNALHLSNEQLSADAKAEKRALI
jgi:hypothetical protein